MAKRTRKYLVYMFGSWETIEKSESIITNIRDVMRTIVIEDEFTFVTGTNVIIMCIKSQMDFIEIEEIMSEFLTPHVNTYFLMPKPRKLAYRMDKQVEQHLFNKSNKSHFKHKLINPKLAEELQKSLKFLIDKKMAELKNTLHHPMAIDKHNNSLQIPFTVDGLLDKINAKGIDSLTEEELEFLNNFEN